jgi:origin recognition complex subunit 5
MESCGLRHAVVNCVEACTQRLLFEQLLWQLQPGGLSAPRPRCDSIAAFVLELAKVADRVGRADPPPRTSYIVLDNAERLRGLGPAVLPALLRLPDLAGVAVCPVLISTIIWEKFRGDTGFTEPYLVHFPAYRKDDTLRILALDCPRAEDAEMHRQFCATLFDVFHGPCRDLNELRHLAALFFPLYRAPVEEGKVQPGNVAALYKNIAPHFKRQLSRLYLRETSTAEWRSAAQSGDGAVVPQNVSIELPFMSKHLVVAAYLASFNPASSDVRVFAKRQSKADGRRAKAAGRRAQKSDRPAQALAGPKSFPLERLLAILFSLMEAQIPASAEVYSQISSLVTLGLLSLSSGADNLDAPRYKSLMTFNEVAKLASTLDIELGRYLHEQS